MHIAQRIYQAPFCVIVLAFYDQSYGVSCTRLKNKIAILINQKWLNKRVSKWAIKQLKIIYSL